ncbi:uncharacterized protein LOC121375650 [Gigantopelta aegis]|uniref:uncharacterized protein LOC121375650 n=1 Tax=Gigantopelta aegis TaxID=1735272 RepID=UPI001B888D1F|nr:uncharacterized protein LOC121375650 [Gigantopelta aegis]XP_041359151.1 uncharacterized protein LOC121375650 [Gigantopelta aegis]
MQRVTDSRSLLQHDGVNSVDSKPTLTENIVHFHPTEESQDRFEQEPVDCELETDFYQPSLEDGQEVIAPSCVKTKLKVGEMKRSSEKRYQCKDTPHSKLESNVQKNWCKNGPNSKSVLVNSRPTHMDVSNKSSLFENEVVQYIDSSTQVDDIIDVESTDDGTDVVSNVKSGRERPNGVTKHQHSSIHIAIPINIVKPNGQCFTKTLIGKVKVGPKCFPTSCDMPQIPGKGSQEKIQLNLGPNIRVVDKELFTLQNNVSLVGKTIRFIDPDPATLSETNSHLIREKARRQCLVTNFKFLKSVIPCLAPSERKVCSPKQTILIEAKKYICRLESESQVLKRQLKLLKEKNCILVNHLKTKMTCEVVVVRCEKVGDRNIFESFISCTAKDNV